MEKSERKNCQNCKKDFQIESEDFSFYEKIKVPPPTWCPECRMIRRMMFRNEITLYKRKNDYSGENIISVISSDKPYKIYDYKTWWSDDWDPMEYGENYDFNKTFFKQFQQLLIKTPMIALINGNAVRSEYCQHAFDSKDCYLISGALDSENMMYSNRIWGCRDSIDVYFAGGINFCYEISNCRNSYRLFYSKNSQSCRDSAFLFDCVNCDNCFGCANLRNKSHYIFNKPYSKEEYKEKIKKLDLGSFERVSKTQEGFRQIYKTAIHKYANIKKSVNTIGDNVDQSKNCFFCFDLFGPVEDSKFQWWGGSSLKDSYDGGPGTGDRSELLYEGVDNGIQSSRTRFSLVVWSSHDTHYCYNCHSSSNLFACVGLRNKQYCILNKQYAKEEYEKLVPKIIKHMNDMPYVDKKGRVYKYGEFFPPELSPFAYNETIAQEYFPLTKEQAIEKGYSWKDPEKRNYQITIKSEDLPDHIKDVPDSIINEIIECQHQGTYNEQCTTAFKIIPQELQFYRQMNLPLPRLCPNCRHYERLKQRNPLKLWHRKCQCNGEKSSNGVYQNTVEHLHHKKDLCPNEFETSYAPDRPEIVYCEHCYQQEVV